MDERMENPHAFLSPEWYAWTHNCVLPIHEHFMAWTKTIDRGTGFVLEVGCGKHDWYYRQFLNVQKWNVYSGIDVSEEVIQHRKAATPHDNLAALGASIEGFSARNQERGLPPAFDLVFSHAVIDHAKDPDLFIRTSLDASTKYTYIMSYRGFFPDIEEHKIEKSSDGYFYNDISVKQVRRLLNSLGHKYELKEVPTGRPPLEIQSELHIIVTK